MNSVARLVSSSRRVIGPSVRSFVSSPTVLKSHRPTLQAIKSEENYKAAAVSLLALRNMDHEKVSKSTSSTSSSSDTPSTFSPSRSKITNLLSAAQPFTNASPATSQKRYYTYIRPIASEFADAAEYEAYGSADYQEPESFNHNNYDWYADLDDVSGNRQNNLSFNRLQPSVRGGDGEVYTVT